MGILDRLHKYGGFSNPYRCEISFDDSGIQLAKPDQRDSDAPRLKWEQITNVFGYKKDCFSTDQVRLLLGNELMGYIELTEDDPGFKSLARELQNRLNGFPRIEDWFSKLTQDAFEPNWTHLYHRT